MRTPRKRSITTATVLVRGPLSGPSRSLDSFIVTLSGFLVFLYFAPTCYPSQPASICQGLNRDVFEVVRQVGETDGVLGAGGSIPHGDRVFQGFFLSDDEYVGHFE